MIEPTNTTTKSNSDTDEEEETNAAVRALAAALAPSILETEEILQVPLEFRSSTTTNTNGSGSGTTRKNHIQGDHDDDDDDNLDDEVDALKSSEALLRQELEMAHDFSSLFQFTHIVAVNNDDDDDRNVEEEIDEENNRRTKTPININDNAKATTDNVIATDTDDDECAVNETLAPIQLPNEPISPTKSISSDRTDNRNDTDTDNEQQPFILVHPSPSLSLRRHTYHPIPYTVRDHQRILSVRKESTGWYSVGIGRHFGITGGIPSTTTTTITTTDDDNDDDIFVHDAVREYCLSMPASTLQKIFVGLPDRNVSSMPAISTATTDDNEPSIITSTTQEGPGNSSRRDNTKEKIASATIPPFPVRTITMQIRPDVLCGAVMDVVHHAFVELRNVHVTKRQGGHIQGVVAVRTTTAQATHSDHTVPFMIDARLVTSKLEKCDRVLLIRIYHQNCNNVNANVPDANEASFNNMDEEVGDQSYDDNTNDILFENNTSRNIALHVREAAALIQIMESTNGVKRRIMHHPTTSGIVDLTSDAMSNVVSTHLLEHYRACPSVKDMGITLPSLNAEDFAVIQSSGRLIQLIWDEIETRDLAYITLRSSRFGSFPSLPTLDVHYCSQLRRISRESMTTQLIKSASELERYAREAELACANMITLLRPTFEVFGVEAPQLPIPKQLTEYPFDFVSSQTSCPPWGVKVQHTLNEIQAWTGDANREDAPDHQIFPITQSRQYVEKSIDMANTAVRLVLEAFQKQDDDEQSARLGRKNMQVMDRLAKMQAHELLSIQTIQNCYNISEKALLASQHFFTKCGIREVPLLKWTIMVGRSTGTCTITANHILFVTKLIPIMGGSKTVVYNVDDVELIKEDAVSSMLNPLPTIIYVKQNRRTVFTFRPSTGAVRLTSFFHVVKGAASRTTMFDVSD